MVKASRLPLYVLPALVTETQTLVFNLNSIKLHFWRVCSRQRQWETLKNLQLLTHVIATHLSCDFFLGITSVLIFFDLIRARVKSIHFILTKTSHSYSQAQSPQGTQGLLLPRVQLTSHGCTGSIPNFPFSVILSKYLDWFGFPFSVLPAQLPSHHIRRTQHANTNPQPHSQ